MIACRFNYSVWIEWLALQLGKKLTPYCILLKFGPKIRMSDLDQFLGALADGFSEEIRDAEFRNNIVNVAPRRCNTGAGRQGWDDS
jgi:hypothetical protein